MNKLIRKLLETLFDDYDDIILSDNDIEKDSISIGKKICDDEDKEKIKEWIYHNVTSDNGHNNIDDEITFEYIDNILYCNLFFNSHKTIVKSKIPDYIKINKVTCKNIKFNSLYNLPREIDGTMMIYDYNNKKLIGDFPEKIGRLLIFDSNINSLEGLNDNCKSIMSLEIESCNNFQYFMGIPENVGRISIQECNKLKNLIGLPESVNDIALMSLRNFESLEGCPKQLNNDLRIIECMKLLSLEHISSLIIGDCIINTTGIEHFNMSKTTIIGDFIVNYNNKLINLSDGPKEVKGNYDCSYNKNLISLNAQDTFMSGYKKIFDCRNNKKLKTLDGLPMMDNDCIKVKTDLHF